MVRRKRFPKTPDQFFAKPAPGDAEFVAEALHLVEVLAAQHAAAGNRGRYVEILAEEYAALRAKRPDALTAGDAAFVPRQTFPSRGVLRRADGVEELKALATVLDRTRYLAGLLGRVERHQRRYDEELAGLLGAVVLALRRVAGDPETSPRAERRLAAVRS